MIRRIPWRPFRIGVRLALGLFIFAAGWLTITRLTAPMRAVRTYTVEAAASRVTSHAASPADDREEPRPTLRVIAFNIAHGRGLAESNYNGESDDTRRDRLIAISDLLRSLDGDVVVLNEVDFDSSWSGRVNQAEVIARAAGYRHVVEQTSFDTALPLWRLRFGNAVLSRHPIEAAERLPLPAQARWESLVAGHKRALVCTIHPDNAPAFRLVAVHLEHRDEAVRITSAAVINALIEGSNLPVIVAGDLNSTPPHFPHAHPIDGVTALSTLLATGRLHASIPQSPDESDFTYRSDRPSVLIDWVLAPHACRIESSRVVPTDLSDHRPVIVGIEWPLPGHGE